MVDAAEANDLGAPLSTTFLLGLCILSGCALGGLLRQMGSTVDVPAAILGGILGLLAGPSLLGLVSLDVQTLEGAVFHGLAVVNIAVALRTPSASRPRDARPAVDDAHTGRPSSSLRAGVRACAFGIAWNNVAQLWLGLALVALARCVGVRLHSGYGLLLALGFEQGPGPALALGASWEMYGLRGGGSLGLIYADIGYAWAVVAGLALLHWGRRRGLLASDTTRACAHVMTDRGRSAAHEGEGCFGAQEACGHGEGQRSRPTALPLLAFEGCDQGTTEQRGARGVHEGMQQPPQPPGSARAACLRACVGHAQSSSAAHAVSTEPLTTHVASIGVIYLCAYSLLPAIETLAGQSVAATARAFVWAIGMALAACMRAVHARLPEQCAFLCDETLASVSALAVDGMTCASLMALDVRTLSRDALPVLLVCTVGGTFTLASTVWLAPRAFASEPFEHLLVWFGASTGTMPIGLALLRAADPQLASAAAFDYALGQIGAGIVAAPLLALLVPAVAQAEQGENVRILAISLLFLTAIAVVLIWLWTRHAGLRLTERPFDVWLTGDNVQLASDQLDAYAKANSTAADRRPISSVLATTDVLLR